MFPAATILVRAVFRLTNLPRLAAAWLQAMDAERSSLLYRSWRAGRVKTSATRKPDWLIVAVVI